MPCLLILYAEYLPKTYNYLHLIKIQRATMNLDEDAYNEVIFCRGGLCIIIRTRSCPYMSLVIQHVQNVSAPLPILLHTLFQRFLHNQWVVSHTYEQYMSRCERKWGFFQHHWQCCAFSCHEFLYISRRVIIIRYCSQNVAEWLESMLPSRHV